MFRSVLISSAAISSLCCALAQTAPTSTAPAADPLPAGPGKEIVQKTCVACHSIQTVTAKRGTKDEWNKTVDKMIEHGAALTDAEADTVVQYLSASFPAKPANTTGGEPTPSGNSH